MGSIDALNLIRHFFVCQHRAFRSMFLLSSESLRQYFSSFLRKINPYRTCACLTCETRACMYFSFAMRNITNVVDRSSSRRFRRVTFPFVALNSCRPSAECERNVPAESMSKAESTYLKAITNILLQRWRAEGSFVFREYRCETYHSSDHRSLAEFSQQTTPKDDEEIIIIMPASQNPSIIVRRTTARVT